MISQKFDPAADEAIQTLVHVLAGGAEATREVCAWITRLQDRQYEGESLTVKEHIALAFILRTGFLDCISNAQQNQKAVTILTKSWLHLTGRRPHILTGRLPRSTLRRADRETRLIHMAAFQPCGPKAAASQKSTGRDYIPEFCDFVVIAVLYGPTQFGFFPTYNVAMPNVIGVNETSTNPAIVILSASAS